MDRVYVQEAKKRSPYCAPIATLPSYRGKYIYGFEAYTPCRLRRSMIIYAARHIYRGSIAAPVIENQWIHQVAGKVISGDHNGNNLMPLLKKA